MRLAPFWPGMQFLSFDADGVYVLSPEAIAAIEEAEAQIARGELATDEEVEAVYRRYAPKLPS